MEDYQGRLEKLMGGVWISLRAVPDYPEHTILRVVPAGDGHLMTHITAYYLGHNHSIVGEWLPLKWLESDEYPDWFLKVEGPRSTDI